jgi:Phosphodiester glycosidase
MKPAKPTRRIQGVLAAALCLTVGLAVPGAEAGSAGSRARRAAVVKTRRVAPGLKFTRIIQRGIPRRTFVLTMNLEKAITLDTTLTEAALPSRAPLSRVVDRAGALAGVNGDWGDRGPGTPVHVFAQDGDLLHTTDNAGALFGLSRNETQTQFGHRRVEVTLTDESSGRVLTVDRWNQGNPAPGELAGFSPLGGSLEEPPANACSARLLPEGPPRPADPEGVDRSYSVDVVRCSEAALGRQDGVVISAPPATDEATELLALTPGSTVRVHWTVGWSNVFDVVGGGPILMRDGNILGVCGRSCGTHPRTAIGVKANGRILLVVIDGRQPGWSRGVTLLQLARTMGDLGAVTAMSLDGGGSSEMVVRDKVVNRPSDGQERHITNAILVLPGPDPGE